MPLYEYRCGDCNTQFEKLTSFEKANNGVQCPECGSAHARRLISVFASFSPSSEGTTTSTGGGCGCGGACSCGGH